jgi:hypothetical protein
MKSFWLTAIVLICSAGMQSAFGQAGTVERIGRADRAELSALKNSLEDKGYRLSLDNKPLAEIWLRKSLAAKSGASYSDLPESTLVGAISFPSAATDFRGQAIKPGVYTLRYEAIPDDGNHLGVSPSPDFLLLIPAASDPGPEATLKFDATVDLSRKASGTHHPSPLMLTQPSNAAAPTFAKDAEGHWVFSTKVKLESGEMKVAFVVKGTAAQ